MGLKVSASILCADFARLGDEIKKCEDAGVDMFHVDVMDGHFVPNITVGAMIVEAIRPLTKLPIEAHLMIEHPWDSFESFVKAGTDIISIQVECYGPRRASSREYNQYPKEVDSIDAQKMKKDIAKIKEYGKRVFAVINPGTPLCIEDVLQDLDGVLIMSVNPGFAKQKYMPEAAEKVKQLRKVFKKDIEIDGGINDATAPQTVKAGVNILATASYLFGAADRKKAVNFLKNLK